MGHEELCEAAWCFLAEDQRLHEVSSPIDYEVAPRLRGQINQRKKEWFNSLPPGDKLRIKVFRKKLNNFLALWPGNIEHDNLAVLHFNKDPEALLKVARIIPPRANFFSAGAEALAMVDKRGPDKRKWIVYRIGHLRWSPRPRGEFATQPLKTWIVKSKPLPYDVEHEGHIKIEALPYRYEFSGYGKTKHPTGRVMRDPWADVKTKYAAAKRGVWLSDLHHGNFGVNPQTGQPEVIDPGSFSGMDKPTQQALLKAMREVDPSKSRWDTYLSHTRDNTFMDRFKQLKQELAQTKKARGKAPRKKSSSMPF